MGLFHLRLMLYVFTVKPAKKGHHWGQTKVSSLDRCPLFRGTGLQAEFESGTLHFALKQEMMYKTAFVLVFTVCIFCVSRLILHGRGVTLCLTTSSPKSCLSLTATRPAQCLQRSVPEIIHPVL
jgi:hypothetical protein